MSVKLRFVRIGKKNHPAYRLCAIDSHKARDGQYIENLGFYDPYIADDKKKIRIAKDRAEYWLSVGALPSQTVLNFFKKEKIAGLIRKPKSKRRRKTIGRQGGALAQGLRGAAGQASSTKPPRKPKPPKKPKQSPPPAGQLPPPAGQSPPPAGQLP